MHCVDVCAVNVDGDARERTRGAARRDAAKRRKLQICSEMVWP